MPMVVAVNSASQRLRMGVRIRERTYSMVLSTGATANFMAKRLMERIGFSSRPEKRKIIHASGETSSCGITSVSICSEDGKKALRTEFLIMDKLLDDIILGCPTIRNIEKNLGGCMAGILNGEEVEELVMKE